MDNLSKPISKTDDASKQMQIDSLKGDQGHGFDIDTIYFVDGEWYIFEYLKCENFILYIKLLKNSTGS